MRSATLAGRGLAARAGAELMLANARYWRGVAPAVRTELARWTRRAQAIADPELRTLALSKLDDEGFHAEAAAMLATLAPRAQRCDVVEAIVALELLFDYLDGLSERSSPEPLGDGERLFGALIDAVGMPAAVIHDSPDQPKCNDGGYLEALSRTVAVAVARLPAAAAITDVAQRNAARSGQAQTRMHAAAQLGIAQLERWARVQAEGTGLGWRELVAGAASSVLVLHALIAAAADPHTTSQDAERIAQAYLPACVVLTLLDGLVDHELDAGDANSARTALTQDHARRIGYVGLYSSPDELADAMVSAARRASSELRALPHGPFHVMLLAGIFAYYASSPGAENAFARPVIARVRRELGPLIAPSLVVMRLWRAARLRGTPPAASAAGESAPAWRPAERREPG